MRGLLRRWHRWFGLLAALWLVLLALTGSAIAFYDDLDRWLNPDWRGVMSAPQRNADVDAALSAAGAALPGFEARFIDLPNAPDESLMLLGSLPKPVGERRTVQVFVTPAGERVMGWRPSGEFSLQRRQLMDSLYVLHTELLLHETGVWLIGLLALLWMFDHVAGVVLAVPRLRDWTRSLRIAGRGMNLRRLYDLHRAPALWLLPLTFTLALTGWCLSWNTEARALVRLASPVSDRLHESFPDDPVADSPAIGVNAAIRASGVAAMAVDSVFVIAAKGAYGIRSFDQRDPDDLGRLWTYVSMLDGRRMGQRHDTGNSVGDMFLAWQYPLHSGRAFGTAGQLLICAAGLGTIVLCLSGLWLWWRRSSPTIKPPAHTASSDGSETSGSGISRIAPAISPGSDH